jgi:hypothetical protein
LRSGDQVNQDLKLEDERHKARVLKLETELADIRSVQQRLEHDRFLRARNPHGLPD